ncbi:TetR/AcrR family transcriptional regulator [Lawsonibacter celer]|jgi:TetR/AcrR family transcriptional regulator|uniref:TetR/AcrR family transcriptional regulator n=1 Tax=Lawsonibacter celer TaxID=2986526 RepID=UPI001648024C|nr:TetR/AcrR family transcriptional regulator [Lawsonibacter celer]
MRQQERQERSRQLIAQAALEEFGSAGYDAVTMDGICAGHGISKGMMYHYYANKDELFLSCLETIFQALGAYIGQETENLAALPACDAIKAFFLLRESFFQERPREKRMFEDAMLRAPSRLSGRIQELRRPLREENDRFLQQTIARMTLRRTLDEQKAARYLNSVYTVFWTITEQYCAESGADDLHSMLTSAEEILDMVAFGMVQQSDSESSVP